MAAARNRGIVTDELLARELEEREARTRTQQDTDQTASDLDQTLADTDQSGSEADEAAAHDDQRDSDADQHASDRDQAAADWESAHGPKSSVAQRAHAASRQERSEATQEREDTTGRRASTTAQRLVTAAERDEVARVRDLTADARDQTARSRDKAAGLRAEAAEAREREAIETGNADEAITALRTLRLAGNSILQRSEMQRRAAAKDRKAAAADRQRAAIDRRHAGLDELTGIFRRGTGEMALTNEIKRARRLSQPLVLAMIDVDFLKEINDTEGHATGDALLRDVTAAITGTMRAYDVTVRWGGDEFVCALSNATIPVASGRIKQIQHNLQHRRPGATISAGLAQLDPDQDTDDTLDTLVARADTALYKNKKRRAT